MATIQCFRLYGADLISAPVDGDGVDVDVLEQLIAVHKPKLVYLNEDNSVERTSNTIPVQLAG